MRMDGTVTQQSSNTGPTENANSPGPGKRELPGARFPGDFFSAEVQMIVRSSPEWTLNVSRYQRPICLSLRESAGPLMRLGTVLLAESPVGSLFRNLGGFSSENDLCYADR